MPSAHTVGKELATLMGSRARSANLRLAERCARETLALYILGGPEPPASDREALERINLLWGRLRGFLEGDEFADEITNDAAFEKFQSAGGEIGKPEDWTKAARLVFRYDERGETWYCEQAKSLPDLEKEADEEVRQGVGSDRYFRENFVRPVTEALARLLLRTESEHRKEQGLVAPDPGRTPEDESETTADDAPPPGQQATEADEQSAEASDEPQVADGNGKHRDKRPAPRIALAVAGVLLILAAISAASLLPDARIGGETLRSSTDPEARLLCGEGKTDDYVLRPARIPDDPDLVDPARLSVSVGEVTFRFDSLTQHDRPGGFDSWDFNFRSREVPELSFVFRRDISSGGGFGYVIDGPPGDGLEPVNEVCRLIDFSKTEMGEFLKERSNDGGLGWAIMDS